MTEAETDKALSYLDDTLTDVVAAWKAFVEKRKQ